MKIKLNTIEEKTPSSVGLKEKLDLITSELTKLNSQIKEIEIEVSTADAVLKESNIEIEKKRKELVKLTKKRDELLFEYSMIKMKLSMMFNTLKIQEF